MKMRAVDIGLFLACTLAAISVRAETIVLVDGATQFELGKGTSSQWGFPTTFDDAQGTSRQVLYSDDRLEVQIGPPGFISMLVNGPTGSRLAPGTYADAGGTNMGALAGDPTAWTAKTVAINGRGCNESDGWVKVYESEFGASPTDVKLALDVLHWCDRDQAPLFIAVRVDSAVPLTRPQPYAVAGRTQYGTEGETVKLDAYGSYSYTGSPLRYSWRQVGGPAVVLSNSESRTATFTVPDVPPGGLPLTFQLTVTDAENDTDTDLVTVQTYDASDPRTRALLHSRAGDPIFAGWRELYANDPTAGDIKDLVYTLSESEFAARGWQFGTYGTHIEMQGSFRPRRDIGIDYPAVGTRLLGLFSAPRDSAPAPGRFVNGQSIDPNATTLPFITVASVLQCNTSIGAFEILELEFGAPEPGGGLTVAKAAIDFEQYCAGLDVKPPITGSIRLNSAIPLHDGIAPPLAQPSATTVRLTIAPNPVVVNAPVTFTWSSTNANYCYGFNGFPATGVLAPSGSVTTSFLAAEVQDYSIRCFTSNSVGEDVERLTVSNAPPPPSSGGGGGGGGSLGGGDVFVIVFFIVVGRRRRSTGRAALATARFDRTNVRSVRQQHTASNAHQPRRT